MLHGLWIPGSAIVTGILAGHRGKLRSRAGGRPLVKRLERLARECGGKFAAKQREAVTLKKLPVEMPERIGYNESIPRKTS